MTESDKKLYELLGDKTLSFGCVLYMDSDWTGLVETVRFVFWTIKEFDYIAKDCSYHSFYDPEDDEEWDGYASIIGHEPTIFDLHKWLNDNGYEWGMEGHLEWHQEYGEIAIWLYKWTRLQKGFHIPYDSSLPLLQQEETTKQAIISLIESYVP